MSNAGPATGSDVTALWRFEGGVVGWAPTLVQTEAGEAAMACGMGEQTSYNWRRHLAEIRATDVTCRERLEQIDAWLRSEPPDFHREPRSPVAFSTESADAIMRHGRTVGEMV